VRRGRRRSRTTSLVLRILKISFEIICEGLVYTGYAAGMTPLSVYAVSQNNDFRFPVDDPDAMPPEIPALPSEHPEQLVADVPLSAQELRLWSELAKPEP
jgi:Family of unknown function (DUF6059)